MRDNLIFDVHRDSKKLRIKFSSDMELVDRAVEEVKILMKEIGLKRYLFDVHIVMREGLTNAVRHGNQNDDEKLVSFEIDVKPKMLTMTIEDQGKGFDWKNVKENCKINQDMIIPLDHGRGFTIMDEYCKEYRYNDKGNILIVKKDISV